MDAQNKIPKLEVLSETGKDVGKFFLDIGRGYTNWQLTSTFNIPGYRFAKKS